MAARKPKQGHIEVNDDKLRIFYNKGKERFVCIIPIEKLVQLVESKECGISYPKPEEIEEDGNRNQTNGQSK